MPLKSISLCTLTFCFAVTFIFTSCKNSGSSDGGSPVNNSYLASARNISSEGVQVDSFSYDDKKRVATFAQYTYPSDGSNPGKMTAVFNFSGNNVLPDSYMYNLNDEMIVLHELTFDGQGRIIKDTSTGPDHFVSYFTYPGNYIITRSYAAGDLSSEAVADTMVVTDGNMTGGKIWFWDPTKAQWNDEEQVTYGRAAAANPGYKAEVAAAVGPLLHALSLYNFSGYGDYVSKSIMNKMTGLLEGLPPGGISYTTHVDGSGRVTELLPSAIGAEGKIVFTYY